MKLNVSFRFSPDRVIRVGTLYQNGRDSAFEYAQSFFAEKLNPAPFRLPVKEGVNIFDWSGGMETFGMFEDSLPDGWGRLFNGCKRSLEACAILRFYLC